MFILLFRIAAASRRAVLLSLASTSLSSLPEVAKADGLTDSFELSLSYSTLSQGLATWNGEVALMQLGQEGKLSKSVAQITEPTLRRIAEAGGEAGRTAGSAYQKHSASMLTNIFLARGATKYETAAVAQQYMDKARADALLVQADLQALGSQAIDNR